MIRKIAIILFVLLAKSFNAQNIENKVLLTIDKEPILVSEFISIYNKNKDIVTDENKKSINEYLDMFVNYKLKLKEAYDLKLDTVPSYVREFSKYKNQLLEPYLKNTKVSDHLVREAYDRIKLNINASHILIKLKPQAIPSDTLKAYNKLLTYRNRILKGEKFEDLANSFSEDRQSKKEKKDGGNLGYFSVFSMIYSFENVAYNTKIDSVSMPFKSIFGYHILKVNDKKASKGEIEVAHIMINHKPNFAKKQIDDIYKKYKQGETFEHLAKTYSSDKASSVKGDLLNKFSQTNTIQSFADTSFKLKEIGDVSKPFKTNAGWHFVKLIKKHPIKSFEELKEELTKKIKKSDRSVLEGKSIATKLRTKYKVKLDNKILNEVLNATKEINITDKTFLTIENKSFTTNDLKEYFKKNTKKSYKDFIDDQLITYYKDNLENENQEYAATLKEYKDGLLLFDLLQKKIWNKAEKDSIGLKKYFSNNKTNYIWKEHVSAEIASCTNINDAKTVAQYLKEGRSVENIKSLVNKNSIVKVLFNVGTYELDSKKLPKKLQLNIGVSKIIVEDNERYTIVNIKKILPTSQKQLDNIKGKVISDYQNFLEKKWVKELRDLYTVKINNKVLKKLIKKHKL